MKKHIYVIVAVCAMVLCGCETQDKQVADALPVVQVSEVMSVTSNSALLRGELVSNMNQNEKARFFFEWSTDANFSDKQEAEADTIDLNADAGHVISYRVHDLEPATDYYYRVRLDKFSRYSGSLYSDAGTFRTSNQAPSITVVTKETGSITSCTARTKASVTVTACTLKESGLLLNAGGKVPTLDNYLQKRAGKYTVYAGTWRNLTPTTTYSVRAYAINTEGTVYYGETRSFTTKSEPGGSLTVNDFTGTFTASAYSPWESKTVSWTNVKIVIDNLDTVMAYGWNDKTYFRAVGIFDKGRQVIRFESDWYFPKQTFTYDGVTCYAQFTPSYYNATDKYAYYIEDGGRNGLGEIWLKKTGTSSFQFAASEGDDQYGHYANGFIFSYRDADSNEEKGNSHVYTSVKMTRTSTSTAVPARMSKTIDISTKTTNTYDSQTVLDGTGRAAVRK